MKIGLIAMSGVRIREPELAALGVTLPGFLSRGKVIASLPSLGLLTVAGLTPADVDVAYREIGAVTAATELEAFDLVGISSYSAQIDEAYALADRYRAAGVPVVLGGLHVSLMPDEAARHADAIVVGGAEQAWPRLVADFRAGRMRRRYEGLRDGVFAPGAYAKPRFDLLRGRAYNRVTVQTSRGCPRSCEFCGASLRITDRFQQKPVDLAIAEIADAISMVDRPFLELADDNTFVNKAWSRDFLRRLAPLGVKWFTETDIAVADDPDLLDRIADSGCRQLLVGLESARPDALKGIDRNGWKRRQADRYAEAIYRIQSRGISVNGCFIVGLDGDTPETLAALPDYVRDLDLAEVQVTLQTPFPGTPLYHRLRRAGRLFKDRFWDRCTLFDTTHRPSHMTVAELESGLRGLFTELYSDAAARGRKRGFAAMVRAGAVSHAA